MPAYRWCCHSEERKRKVHDIVQSLKNQKTEAEKDEEARGRVNKTWNAKGFDKHVTKLDNLSRAYSARASTNLKLMVPTKS